MKSLKYLFLAILCMMMLAGCKNLSKKAEADATNLSDKTCQLLSTYKKLKTPGEFTTLKDSCEKLMKADFDKYKQVYGSDTAAWRVFETTYQEKVANVTKEFRSAYGSSIASYISDTTWLRDKEKKGYYLYSFVNDTLTIQNCKKSIRYSLNVDTLTFEDEAHTRAIVSFTTEPKMMISSLDGTQQAVYEPMTEKSKFYGVWLKPDTWCDFTITYRANGTGTLATRFWGESYAWHCTYSVKNKILYQNCNMDGQKFTIHDKYTFSKNMNVLTMPKTRMTRILKAFPKDMSILYN